MKEIAGKLAIIFAGAFTALSFAMFVQACERGNAEPASEIKGRIKVVLPAGETVVCNSHRRGDYCLHLSDCENGEALIHVCHGASVTSVE